MSLPPDYVPWCETHGLNPWHPDEWPAAGREAFHVWKWNAAVARWLMRIDDGTWDLVSPERRAELVAEDVAFAEAPPPSRPFTSCPCHPFTPIESVADERPPEKRASPAEVAVWIDADPATRAALEPKTAACLAWLEATFADPAYRRAVRRLRSRRVSFLSGRQPSVTP
jgi:hypothetical protein